MPDLSFDSKITIAEIGDGGVVVVIDEYDMAEVPIQDYLSDIISWDDCGKMKYRDRLITGRLVAYRSVSIETRW